MFKLLDLLLLLRCFRLELACLYQESECLLFESFIVCEELPVVDDVAQVDI